MTAASSYKKDPTRLAATFSASDMSRRRFLQVLGSAFGGAATAGILVACNDQGTGSESGGEAEAHPPSGPLHSPLTCVSSQS
jgi:hypothetical protein